MERLILSSQEIKICEMVNSGCAGRMVEHVIKGSVKENRFYTPLFMAVPQAGLGYAMGASVVLIESGRSDSMQISLFLRKVQV